MIVQFVQRSTSQILQSSTKNSFLLAYVRSLFASCTRRLLFVSQQLLSAAGRRTVTSRDLQVPACWRLKSLRNLTLTCSLAGMETGREHCVQRQGDNDKVSCSLIALPITLALCMGGARGGRITRQKAWSRWSVGDGGKPLRGRGLAEPNASTHTHVS